jgi:hypothetical protein
MIGRQEGEAMTFWDHLLVRGLPLKRAVRGALVGRVRSRSNAALGRFTRRDCDRLVDATLLRYSRLVATVPPQPNLGSRITVRLAAVLLAACLDAMLEEGLERDYAIELIGDTAWRIYRRWGQAGNLLVAPFARDPVHRIRSAVGLFLYFPFGEPGYQREDILDPAGRRFNCVSCPTAAYLVPRGDADLMLGAGCNLDYALAELWGGRLERDGTIADGRGRCAFRFVGGVPPATPGAAEPSGVRATPIIRGAAK